MQSAEEPTALDRLHVLLDRERTVLISGDLAGLADLAEAREALLPDLSAVGDGSDAARVKSLLVKADANRVLLHAAMEGVRDVSRRLRELGNLGRAGGTYGPDGARPTQSKGSMIRRA